MIGNAEQRAALVLLVCAAAVAAAADITITSMDWTYTDTLGPTNLKICTDTDMSLMTSITLTVSPSGSAGGSFSGEVDANTMCANFNDVDKLLPPAVETKYEITVHDGVFSRLTGSASFGLEGATITCSGSQYFRFKPSAGTVTVDGASCTPVDQDTTCYVAAADFPSGSVCVSDFGDPNNPDLTVCVQRSGFTELASDGAFAVDELNYATPSFSFTSDTAGVSLAEFLIVSGDPINQWTVVLCDSGSPCVYSDFAPSNAHYDLCGVFTDDGSNVAANFGVNEFQDLDLIADRIESIVDFHFLNMREEENKVYFASYIDTLPAPQGGFTLDCNNIDPGEICNGFFDEFDTLQYVVLAYDEAGVTNRIVSLPVP